jgi:hypothetical protein
MPHESKQIATLEMHLPAGFSKVRLELGGGIGLAGGPVYWDIPTETIPPHLRKLGSRFLVIQSDLAGPLEVANMTPDEIRSRLGYRVVELSETNE